MLYLAVSQFAAVEHHSRAHALNQFGVHDAAARPRRYPSLWQRLWSNLGLGQRAGWAVRPAYAFRPLESAGA
jgi:hypothetical protein